MIKLFLEELPTTINYFIFPTLDSTCIVLNRNASICEIPVLFAKALNLSIVPTL